jgi:hypothetical protein
VARGDPEPNGGVAGAPNQLRSERATLRNDGRQIPPIEVSALYGTIIRAGVAHIGPVDVASRDVHNHAVRKSSTLIDDRFQIGAVGVHGEHAAAAQIQKEQAARSGLGAGFVSFDFEIVEDIEFACSFSEVWIRPRFIRCRRSCS